MRKYKLSFFFGQAFKGLWRNGMMTLASVTVLLSCLIVMGCFSMLVMNIDHNLNELGDLNEIVAFVQRDTLYTDKSKSTLPTDITETTLAPVLKGKNGETFLGWSTDPDAVTPQYKAGEKYVIAEGDAVGDRITMYAVWDNIPKHTEFSVMYSAVGLNIDGELSTDENSYKANDEVTLAPGLAARYSTIEFLGWSLSPDAEAADFVPGAVYTASAEDARGGVITFYAVWSEKPTISKYEVIYDSNSVSVENLLTDYEVRVERITNQLGGLDNISGIRFVSKEETLEEEKERLADYPNVLSALVNGENPYPDTFIIKYKDNAKVSSLQLQLEHIEGIEKIRCRADIAESIESLKNGIILVFTWFMVILFVVSIFVIINTVKLAVVHRSKEITIMRYVGATKWFITLPFQLEGIIIGLFSGTIAYLLQWYMYGYIQKMTTSDLQMISIIPFGELKLLILAGCLVTGVLTGLIGSAISLRKYLKA